MSLAHLKSLISSILGYQTDLTSGNYCVILLLWYHSCLYCILVRELLQYIYDTFYEIELDNAINEKAVAM